MTRLDLAAAHWTIEACGDVAHAPHAVRSRAFPARVPGCVHSDLIRAGVIGHPNIAFHEEACQWIGRTDWRYRCVFTIDAPMLAHDRIDLVCDGLDTIAVCEVNGQRIGEAVNMHHAHRFNVRKDLPAGTNELVITLRGPVTYVEQQEQRLGARPVNGDWTPYSYIRKMASNFQWDWGPRVATCGIWRGVRLEAWSGARIASARPVVMTATDDQAELRVDVEVEALDLVQGPLQCKATLQRGLPIAWTSQAVAECVDGRTSHTFVVDRPALWQPRGRGAQSMYGLTLSLEAGEAATYRGVLDVRALRVGMRTTSMIAVPNDAGAFGLAVNGQPIFCKGANWIPEGLFPEDQSPERIRERVQQAADANFNMLRVWGGGTYEQDAFYDACDDLGIMVWQDFMFACATYPEDEPYPALIEREAREAVTRLAHHPSIVLWCGGNENVLGYESWGWKQRMPKDQKWGERYFFDILPRVTKELDPSRSYWPDSPHSDAARTSMHPNDPDHGDRHTWDAKVEGYRDIVPRFCSEFGHQSPPCWATMNETWGAGEMRLDSRAIIHRQRATGGNDVWYGPKVMGGRWREPRDFDEWLYQAHLLQARAISIGIEWLRANQPRCMGALFWQFNDAWAGHSWSCIDSAGRPKPLWFAVRRSFAPHLLSIQPFDGELRVCAINERMERWDCTMRARRVTLAGETIAEHVERASIEPRECWRSSPLANVIGNPRDECNECIVAESADGACERTWWFHQHDRLLALPKPVLEVSTVRERGELLLTLRARTLVRDAVIAVDRVDSAAEIDDNLITMLPGEDRTLRIKTARDVEAATWITPPVFRCANEFTDHT